MALDSLDYLTPRNGAGNAPILFETTGKGRVAFLGGSITHMDGWRDLVCEDLQKRFPNTEFEFINAGIPSTGSTPGAFRLKKDVFANGPVDLLFEEAAVNDSGNGRSPVEQVRAMEGIVRHARILNPNIDIVIMYFVDPGKMADYNQGLVPDVIRNHDRVVEHYGIPSINLAREVTERIREGEFTWEDDFKDLHPSPFGHEVYRKAISGCLESLWQNQSSDIQPYPLPERLDPFCYDSGKLLSPDAAQGLAGFAIDPSWSNSAGGKTRPGFVDVPMLVGTEPGDSFELEFTGRAVGLFIAAGPDAGIIEFKVDDADWKTVDLFTQWSRWLHIPWLYILEAELPADIKHKLSVRMSDHKNEESKGNACRIVYFAVNDS